MIIQTEKEKKDLEFLMSGSETGFIAKNFYNVWDQTGSLEAKQKYSISTDKYIQSDKDGILEQLAKKGSVELQNLLEKQYEAHIYHLKQCSTEDVIGKIILNSGLKKTTINVSPEISAYYGMTLGDIYEKAAKAKDKNAEEIYKRIVVSYTASKMLGADIAMKQAEIKNLLEYKPEPKQDKKSKKQAQPQEAEGEQ